MKTITFYSFKGGVGRSLTLSNMALWLADEMKAKVCVIDFDLEAPGLPYKFEDLQNPADQERLSRTEGIVEYIDEFKQTGIPPTDFTRFYLPFTTKKGNPITLIPAGNLQQSDYWRKLFEINWQKLFEHDPAMGYSQGLLLLEDLKGRIENELQPDFLLIDSRTGLTEIASITLKLLADKAVLVGINNPENQDGLFWVLRSLHADPASRDLPYHLVLNRVPMQYGAGRKEIDPREKAIGEQFLTRFETLATLETLAERFSIIHADDELAFGEKLQEGFYVETQSKVQTRKDYWDVFTQVVKEYFNSEQWAIFENKRKAFELYYKAKFDTVEILEQINLMNEAIGYCDDDAFLYNYRFILLYDSNNKVAAFRDIQRATEIESDNAALWYNWGTLYDSLKQYDLAVEAYRKALEINPDRPEIWYNLGNTYDHQKQYDLAVEAYRKALEIKPDMHEAWNNCGTIYDHQKQYDLAVEAYQNALEIKTDKYETWYSLGITYGRLQEYDLAVETYQKALEVEPDNHKAWINLSNILVQLSFHQKEPQQTETLQKALQAAHRLFELGGRVYSLARVCALLNNKKQTLYWLQEALERKEMPVEQVKEDRDFASFREDEDFKALLARFSS